MPIFEYKCARCGKVFEKLCVRKDENESNDCPSCGSRETERVLSLFSSSRAAGVFSGASCAPKGGFS